MRFDVESISDVKKKISVEIPAGTVISEIDAAYGKLKNQVKMDGFRKGKVPRPVLERHYKGHVDYEVASRLINESYKRILSEYGIVPVAEPEIDIQPLISGEAFRYSATVEINPGLEIKDYEGIRVEKERVSVTDTMVSEGVEALRRRHATLKDAEHSSMKEGDTGLIDFEGFMDGAPFKGGKAQDVLLKIGSGRFVPGFEEQLVGMSSGDEREVNVKFPEDYSNKEIAGKDATFKVKLKGLKEEILPAADDEFAKDLNIGTLFELKAEIRRGMEKDQAAFIKKKMRLQILDVLMERNPFDAPPSMVEKHKERLMEELKNKYAESGIDINAVIEKDGSIVENIGNTALKQVKSVQILMAIAGKEGITVGDNQVEERLSSIASEVNANVAALRNYYEKNKLIDSLRREILEDKVFDFIIGKANVIEVEGAKI